MESAAIFTVHQVLLLVLGQIKHPAQVVLASTLIPSIGMCLFNRDLFIVSGSRALQLMRMTWGLVGIVFALMTIRTHLAKTEVEDSYVTTSRRFSSAAGRVWGTHGNSHGGLSSNGNSEANTRGESRNHIHLKETFEHDSLHLHPLKGNLSQHKGTLEIRSTASQEDFENDHDLVEGPRVRVTKSVSVV